MTMASQSRKAPTRKRRKKAPEPEVATPRPLRRRTTKARRARIDAVIGTFADHDTMGPAMFLSSHLSRFTELTRHPLYEQIHGRLMVGMPTHKLAMWVQRQVDPDDVLGTASLQMNSLARKLQRYARWLPKTTFLPVTFLEALIKDAAVDVDTMEKLKAAIAYQEERLALGRKIEQQMEMPMEQQRRELAQYAELLRQMRDTQIAFGLIPSAGPSMTVFHAGGASGSSGTSRLGDSSLDRMLAEHPEMLAATMPALKLLESMELPGEYSRVEKDVTPEKETPDGERPRDKADGGGDGRKDRAPDPGR